LLCAARGDTSIDAAVAAAAMLNVTERHNERD
jgi:hypothetical protein